MKETRVEKYKMKNDDMKNTTKSFVHTSLLCCLTAFLLFMPSVALGEETDSYCEDEVIETYAYDPGGKLVSSIDRNGNETKYDYDVFGRVIKTEFADGNIVDYIYDSAGKLTEVHDSVSGFIYFDYDILDNVIKERATIKKRVNKVDGGVS